MNKIEISNLAFLIHSIINKPSIGIFKFLDKEFISSNSIEFNNSVSILKKNYKKNI